MLLKLLFEGGLFEWDSGPDLSPTCQCSEQGGEDAARPDSAVLRVWGEGGVPGRAVCSLSLFASALLWWSVFFPLACA